MPTLNWIGKQKVVNHHLDVPVRSLVQTGGHGESTLGGENRIIHGDNLEALKALLPEYEGRIKCIYIDPPYNTGNEGWVYNDNVNDPRIKRWLHQVVGREGEDLSRHDKWLCMMYPRLKLLHRLLAEDGVIFVSIDDTEVATLQLLMDEIFGKVNFIAQFIWKSRQNKDNRTKNGASIDHEYILCYGTRIRGEGRDLSQFNNPDNDIRGPWTSGNMVGLADKESRPNLHYDLIDPKTNINYGCPNQGWRFERSRMLTLAMDNRILWPQKVEGRPRQKVFLSDMASEYTGFSSIINFDLYTYHGTREIEQIFDRRIFDFPKPSELVRKLLEQIATQPDDIILDSFAGSGTTAHAVLKLNAEDGGNRRFILIEMMDYADSLTAERVRRVIDGYGPPEKAVAGLGGGFGYYEMGPTIFTPDGGLNPETSWYQLARYVWYAETGRGDCISPDAASGCLGLRDGTAYFLHPAAPGASVLDARFLRGIGTKADRYVVYADTCSLAADFMAEHNIAFRKLPRDLPGCMGEQRT